MAGTDLLVLPFRLNSFEKAVFGPAFRLLFVFLSVFVMSSSTRYILIFYVLLAAFTVQIISGAKPLRIWKHLLFGFWLVFVFPLPNIFSKGNTVIWTGQLWLLHVNITQEGLDFALIRWFRGFCCVLAILLTTSSMTETEFIEGLRGLYFPEIIVTMIMLLLRFFPLVCSGVFLSIQE